MVQTCGAPPSGSEKSPGDVQVNGICVGGVAQIDAGIGGEIEVIGAVPMFN
jgi:hypothetical protein